MEVVLTVVTSFVTLIFGQIAVKLVIDPVQEFKRVVADIAHALIEYANVYSNPGSNLPDTNQNVSTEPRKLSSKLNAQMYLNPAYQKSSRLFGLPNLEQVTKATSDLIGLSNGFGQDPNSNLGMRNAYRAQRINDALGIYVSPRERLDPEFEKYE